MVSVVRYQVTLGVTKLHLLIAIECNTLLVSFFIKRLLVQERVRRTPREVFRNIQLFAIA